MSRTAQDRLVAGYLDRLEEALEGLPRHQRRELVDEISAHIASARADLADPSEAEIRTLLERLGDPEDIAADAGADSPRTRRAGPLEVIALILLPIGGLIPVPLLGWFVGVALLWISRMWTTRDKLIGTLVVPGGLVPAVYFGLMPFSYQTVCTSVSGQEPVCTGGPPQWLAIAGPIIGVALVLAPVFTVIYLGRRLARISSA